MVETSLKIFNFQLSFFKRKDVIVLLIVIAVGAFFRLYRISEYMTFLGDEGRDAIVVRRLLMYADPILVGPGTSIGNMYLGPLYYYFMAPWLWFFNYSPVGPAVGVAVLGVATIFLIWKTAKEWFGTTAALISAFLYAIAPTVVIYSRSSWNPNIMPFFSLLCIYSIWQVWKNKSYRWMMVLGVSFAFVLQSHYLGLLLAPVIAIFWLLVFLKAKAKRELFFPTIWGLLIFCFLMSPLVIFDARHGWRNASAIQKFFFERQTTVSARPWNALPKVIPQLDKINSRLITGYDQMFSPLVTLVFFTPVGFFLSKKKKFFLEPNEYGAYLLLFTWLLFGLIGFGLYKQEIYDHYFGFIFAVPFLLIGGISQSLINRYRIRGVSLVIPFVGLLIILNFINNPFKFGPSRQLQRTEEVAQELLKLSNNETFNLAVIAERNYDDAYQYFLEVKNAKMVDIDPQRADETITDQLFVICEMQIEKCNPTNNPKAEVAGFGWSKIDQTWNVAGVTVFKLIHTK